MSQPNPTHVHCRNCRCPQPLRFEQLLKGETVLGMSALCGYCANIAFTLVRTPSSASQLSFCANCDAFCRLRVEASEHTGNVWVCCAACGYALATLYSESKRDSTKGISS